MASDWWRTFFGDPWSKIQAGGYPAARTATECDSIQRGLALSAGARVLDIPCGIGRHSVELARRGFRMTGVDFKPEHIEAAERAAREARVEASFLVGDMREFATTEPFEAAFCYFGSFGYFDEEGDERFARAVAASLLPRGRFAIDAHVAETLFPMFQERSWHWGGEQGKSARILEERRWNEQTGRVEADWAVIDGSGGVVESSVSMRIYTCRELTAVLQRAGFASVRMLDGNTGEPFKMGARRVLAVAETP